MAAAGDLGVQFLVFPELSLTGYEPAIARARTLAPDDARLDPLRSLSVRLGMAVVAGVPMTSTNGRCRLAALAFLPDGSVSTYSKQHLHPGEEVFFEPGTGGELLQVGGETVALAICADANHPKHAANAASRGASVYAAGGGRRVVRTLRRRARHDVPDGELCGPDRWLVRGRQECGLVRGRAACGSSRGDGAGPGCRDSRERRLARIRGQGVEEPARRASPVARRSCGRRLGA